jgi:hypothetical protein
MAETQRRPVPRVDSGELDTALAFLNFNRESVLKKTEGLDDEQLRRRLVPTGTNLLGLVQHLAQAERNWFGYHLAGGGGGGGPGGGGGGGGGGGPPPGGGGAGGPPGLGDEGAAGASHRRGARRLPGRDRRE